MSELYIVAVKKGTPSYTEGMRWECRRGVIPVKRFKLKRDATKFAADWKKRTSK